MSSANASSFFNEMVEPTVSEFLKNRDNKRLGCLACLMLASMSDHYFYSAGADLGQHRDADSYRRSHVEKNWAVGAVIGVANATKHLLSKPGRVGFDDVYTDDISCENFRCGWPIIGRQVMLEAGPDRIWLLSDLVECATEYWAEKVRSLPRSR